MRSGLRKSLIRLALALIVLAGALPATAAAARTSTTLRFSDSGDTGRVNIDRQLTMATLSGTLTCVDAFSGEEVCRLSKSETLQGSGDIVTELEHIQFREGGLLFNEFREGGLLFNGEGGLLFNETFRGKFGMR